MTEETEELEGLEAQAEEPEAPEEAARPEVAANVQADLIEPEDDDSGEMEPVESLGREESRQAIYALLFVTDRPLSPGRIAQALGDIDPDIVAMLLEELREELDGHVYLPYILREIAGGYQLVTKPQFAPFIRRLFQIKRSNRMSKALLETLAVISYKQPVTRAEVESIRGVSVCYAFEQLQEKRFIKVSGVADLPGRPKLYKTTDEFLVQFGMGSLKELPTLDELKGLD